MTLDLAYTKYLKILAWIYDNGNVVQNSNTFKIYSKYNFVLQSTLAIQGDCRMYTTSKNIFFYNILDKFYHQKCLN